MEPVFVGREPEVEILSTAMTNAASGRGSLVLLAGEPGIGKSRLLDEVAQLAANAGMLVAWGRSWEAGGAPAYWIWTEVLRAVSASLGGDWWAEHAGRRSGELADLLPELGTGGGAPAEGDPDEARFALFAASAQLLQEASAERPVVVLLDDLHVADEASLLLLRFLVRHVYSSRLLVVAAYRDVELTAVHPFTPTLERLLREHAVTRLTLRPLDVGDVASIIEAVGTGPAPADLAERVWFHTDGNPLYVRELVRLVSAEGSLESDPGRLRLAIPRDLRATILRRLEGLGDPCRALLEVASVVGRVIPLDVLAAVSGVEDPLRVLQEAIAANVVSEHPDLQGHLRFSHVLVRNALYEELPLARRAELHRSVGQALVELRDANLEGRVAELALHFANAAPVGATAEAAHYAQLAGERSMRLLSFDDAAQWFSLALGSLEADPSAPAERRLALMRAKGEAESRLGATPVAQQTFLRMADLARELRQGEDFCRAVVGYGGRFIWLRAGSDRMIVPLLREALSVAPDDVLRARVLSRLASALRDDADRTEREDLTAEALSIAERHGDDELLAYTLIARFTAIWAPDKQDEMEEVGARAAHHARRSGDRERISDTDWLQFIASLTAGDARTARAIAARHESVVVELRQPAQRWYAGVMETILRLMEGPLSGVEDLIERTLGVGRESQGWDAEASYNLALSVLRWEQGRLAEAEGSLARCVVEFPGYRIFRCLHALSHAEAGDTARATAMARAVLDEGREGLAMDNGWLFGMVMLAEVAALSWDQDLAARLYDPLVPYAHLVAMAGGEPVGGSALRSLGKLATVMGRFDQAERHFEHALSVHEGMGANVCTARTNHDRAIMLARRGGPDDLERARELAGVVAEAARRLGVAALLPALVTLGLLPPDGATAGSEPAVAVLSPRETEIAALVAAGMSNREIAERLYLSERTVETHVGSILRKLACRSRSQVAAWAVANGLTGST